MSYSAKIVERIVIFALIALSAAGTRARADGALQITLTAGLPSPQPVGTPIPFTATIHNPDPSSKYDFQFAAGMRGNNLHILRDFNTDNTFTTATIGVEGEYEIRVVVRDTSTRPPTVLPEVTTLFTLKPLIDPLDRTGMVSPTAHPLVALFSAPACPAGNFIRVVFYPTDSGRVTTTNSVPCRQESLRRCSPVREQRVTTVPCGQTTANFYIAGMLPNTTYAMFWVSTNGAGTVVDSGPALVFTSDAIPSDVPLIPFRVNVPHQQGDDPYPVILWDLLDFTNAYPVTATDLNGQVIWYSPVAFTTLGRNESNGNLWGTVSGSAGDFHRQLLREVDLAGNIQRETNASIINEQLSNLAAKTGKVAPVITGFHHEVRSLPGGNILALAAEEMVSTTVQGGTSDNPIDILGDVVLVLDSNLQLLWYWDSFAHQDISRMATLNDLCVQGTPACLPFKNPQFPTANDWLHSNAAQLTPDGNIIVSERNQDWVVKINYNLGLGDGSILWRMGSEGDFQLVNPPTTSCSVPNAFQWFSHQHDPEFNSLITIRGAEVMSVFDNGNTRQVLCDPNANSRGMLMLVDETNMVVYYAAIMDLGSFSGAVGSAQALLEGSAIHLSFGNGFIGGAPSGYARATETDLNGNVLLDLQTTGVPSYRTFRLQNLYTASDP